MSADFSKMNLKKDVDLERAFSLCGRKCYLIGYQNGLFPDYGWHSIGEMGGIWTHPIKIADGFWLSVETKPEGHFGYKPRMRNWLEACDEFTLGDGGAWIEHKYDLPQFTVVRKQFVPRDEPALSVSVRVSPKDASIKTALLNVLVRFDIIPAWFSGWPDPAYIETEIKDDIVVAHAVSNYMVPIDYGMWSGAMGSDVKPEGIVVGADIWGPNRTTGRGVSCIEKFQLRFDPDAEVRFVLAGDYRGAAGAIETVNRVLNGYEDGYKKKVGWYMHICDELTSVSTPEEKLNDTFAWSKLNLEWMTLHSPIMGTGVVAGYQDFSHYFGGDTSHSIGGILAAGLHETAKDTLRLYIPIGERMQGRIPHEVATNGNVFDWGRVHITSLFAKAVWQTYLWTGDRDFLNDLYPICRMGMFDYTLSQPRQDGILLLDTEDIPDGPRDKLCPAKIAMGFESLMHMAERLGKAEDAEKAGFEAAGFKRQVEELFWVENEGFYVGLLDGNNKPKIGYDTDLWGEMHTTFEGIAYTGIAEPSRAVRALARFEDPMFATEYGLILMEERKNNMPFTSGCAAISEFNYGRTEPGMNFLRMITNTMGHIMPGAAPEYVHKSGDPAKYPIDSCFLQLWSAATYIQGLIAGLLRIRPDAANGKVTLSPTLPAGWKKAEVKNLRVGKTRFSVEINDGTDPIITHFDGPALDIEVKE